MEGGATGAAAPAMLRDIARQPTVAGALLSRAAAFLELGRDLLAPSPGGRVLACGCGDGLFEAEAARGFAEGIGLDWRPVGVLDLVLGARRLTPADRVVAISMSGNVDRTVEAAKAVGQRGVPLLALVNGDGRRLGAISAATVSLDLPDLAPFLCGTASYTATVVTLMLLACGAAGRDAGPLAALPEALAATLAAAERVSPPEPVPTGVRLLSAGSEVGTARYGAAKLVELTRVPAWPGDLEEFAHSQYWSMPATDLVVAIATEPALARYANDSCEALRSLGVPTLAIEMEDAPVPQALDRVTLPAIDPALAPVLSALPLQRLAYGLAERTGLDPNARRHLKDDVARFRVSRLLTRRSLLGTGQ